MKFFHQFHGAPQIIHNNFLTYEAHLHFEIEIIALFDGDATLTVGEKNYTLNKGDFAIVFPNTVHSYFSKKDIDVGKFIFSPDTVPELNTVFMEKCPVSPIIPSEKAEKCGLIALAKDIIKSYSTSSSPVQNAYLTLLAGKILELCELENREKSNHKIIDNIFDYCQKNYTNQITQQDVAAALHISESHLSHIFGSKIKINFRNYINILRTNKACRLILQTDKNIVAISDECGFSSIRSFNRAFVRNVGMTPTQYRKTFNEKNSNRFWEDRFFKG